MVRSELLESRKLLSVALDAGVLSITGTQFGDSIVVSLSEDGTGLVVSDNGTVENVVLADVQSINISTLQGRDTVTVGEDVTVPVTVDAGNGKDSVVGGAGNDTINGGRGKDSIDGGAGDDSLSGSQGKDVINGGDGEDSINGGLGRDLIDGQGDNDQLRGGAGDDSLAGGEGDDSLRGGDGDDVESEDTLDIGEQDLLA